MLLVGLKQKDIRNHHSRGRLAQPRQRRNQLRNPSDDLRRPDRDPTTPSCGFASRIRLSIGMREAAADAERTPPNARASTRGRSVEVRLDIGCVAFDLENDVCGKEESWGTNRIGV